MCSNERPIAYLVVNSRNRKYSGWRFAKFPEHRGERIGVYYTRPVKGWSSEMMTRAKEVTLSMCRKTSDMSAVSLVPE